MLSVSACLAEVIAIMRDPDEEARSRSPGYVNAELRRAQTPARSPLRSPRLDPLRVVGEHIEEREHVLSRPVDADGSGVRLHGCWPLCRGDEEAVRARQYRSMSLTSDGYTIRYRNGLIAAMYAVPSSPFGFTRTAIWPR